jgi:hypothetical protein
MRPPPRTVLIGTGVILALGMGGSTASAAVSHPTAPATAEAAGARGGAPGGTWGIAEEVPGTAALNQGGHAQTVSVSCASAGNCGAGGSYTGSSGATQAFVASDTKGTWGKAEEVRGSAALNKGGDAQVSEVSCTSAGNCSAGGSYTDGAGETQAFVVSETKDTWGTAEKVPGAAALGREASVDVLSCGSAGNCSAGGSYRDGSSTFQAFVVNETNGVWGTAEEVPGTAALNQGGDAHLGALSCTSAGNCSAGGTYDNSSGTQAFVVNETNGTWGTSEEVPGTATLNTGGNATADSVSCGAAGNCAAAGSYKDGSGDTQAFVVNEAGSTWGTAEEVPGTATLNTGGNAVTNSVSCASASKCTAGGSYSDGSFHIQAFVVSEP